MTRTSPGCIALLATVALLACGDASAEPRGSSAGTKTPAREATGARQDRPRRGYVPQLSRSEVLLSQRDQVLDEVIDDATRAARLAELESWIRRIPGRFRIEGRAERIGPGGVVGGKVSGVADCASVGQGVGVHCIFNAMWPILEPIIPIYMLMNGPLRAPPPSEALRHFRPAMMALGLDPALAEVRALLVTDDSLAHTWAGRLNGNTLRANRLTGCRDILPPDPADFRCFQPLEFIAEPGSEIVTIVLRSAGITIRLAMRRDPEARTKAK